MRILREFSRVARRTWRNFLDISSLPFNSPLAFLTYTYTRNYYFIGTLPGIVIKLISEGKANFDGCKGPFTLPTDLSSIKDIEKIDLTSLRDRLQGGTIPSGMFFCFWRTSPHFLGMFLTMPFALPATRTHHALTGNIQVLENCPNLTSVDFDRCKKIEGEDTSNELS